MPDVPAVTAPLRLGVSACLLGEETRYDGGHSHDSYITGTLATAFELVSVCPEAELGMGIPRETVDLVGEVDRPRMVATYSRKDWTGPMNHWCRQRARELTALELCGYVFKRNSPSCGVFRVKVHPEKGRVRRQGRGLFAAEFARRFPLVPLEEEVRLQNPLVRDNFIVRAFALQRLRAAFAERWRTTAIVAFQARESALLQAHDAPGYRRLDSFVAQAANTPRAEFRDRYQAAFMAILARMATTHKQVRALRHLARQLPPAERATALTYCKDFAAGLVPLLVPITMIRHLGQTAVVPRLLDSSYLNPDPRELQLRFHA